MWTLGFDSTASTVTAALLRDDSLVSLYSADSATTHSTTLLPAIENLLIAGGITPRDLSLICCSSGPGSFTGVRIGVATAKGLAAPFCTPCVGVSSLEAMAYMYGEISGIICPALNARRGNVYTALFYSDGNGNISRLSKDDLVPICDIENYITESASEYIYETPSLYLCGDTVDSIKNELLCATQFSLKNSPALIRRPNGYGTAVCGIKKFTECNMDRDMFDQKNLLPIYLRKSQAEREKEAEK